MDRRAGLIVCPDCDLVQAPADLVLGGLALCCRCGGRLYRNADPRTPERCAAILVGALILLAIAHVFPVLGLQMQGHHSSARLMDAVRLLHADGMSLVALLVFLFTLAMPLLQVAGMLAVLFPVLLGRRPGYLPRALRLVRAATPWSMVEVMILGVLVSLVKLAKLATILPGIALWAFGGFIVLLAAASAALDVRDLWRRLEPQPCPR